MGNSKKMEEFINVMEANKEILSTMPKNNKKNTQIYNEKVNELFEEYSGYREEILKIFQERYETETNIEIDKDIETLDSRINTIENVLFLLSEEKTSYEKMELDKNIYKLSRYYKENLENVNTQIKICLKEFSKVGVDLKLEDFNYSVHANDYMKSFFEELNSGDVNSKTLKTKFEEIYWQCPDVIMHIELNFRDLYLANQAIIDKYFEKEKVELLRKWEKTPEGIRNTLLDLKRQKIEKIDLDKKIILDQFLSGKLNTKNFTDDKIKADCVKLVPKSKIGDEVENNIELLENVDKFLNSLYEYKNYVEFKYFVDDVRKLYKEKDKYKKAYDDTKKKIDTLEKQLKRANTKLKGKGILGFIKKDLVKQTAEQNNLILEIKELYKSLDLDEFYQKMCETLDDNSTIYDVLNLVSSYYNYSVKCLIKNNPDITQEEMDEKIKELIDFINSPYNTIINNTTMIEEKDIQLIIKDRYKLLNFLVEKEDLELNSVDSLITTLEEIKIGCNIKKIGIDLDDIDQLLNVKKILKIK